MCTVLIFGDQLNLAIGALSRRSPQDCRVLLITSDELVTGRRWHRQRLHMILSAMTHFAAELRSAGFVVDERRAATMTQGLADHVSAYRPSEVVATEPNSRNAMAWCAGHGVTTERSNQFLCHRDDFAQWAHSRSGKRLRMEDFYRRQRIELGVLMDGEEPTGGVWNFDHENREPPPRDGRSWPSADPFDLDDLDRQVIEMMPADLPGAEPFGQWPVTRAQALSRLESFVDEGLPNFGPHEDAMLAGEWKLAHSVLSASLNIGLLLPGEIVEAAEAAARQGTVPLASAEGFIRQIMGWREYVWGIFWWFGPEYAQLNELDAHRPLPASFGAESIDEIVRSCDLACVTNVLSKLHQYGWTHHIERLMILGNLSLLLGLEPLALTRWMHERFVDGAEWVMVPNVVGMALYADGGQMATKPYASGGAYINRMSDHCRGCRYDPKLRTGPTACPFTSMYWDLIARHGDRFASNHRMSRAVAASRRLSDLDATRARAAEVRVAIT